MRSEHSRIRLVALAVFVGVVGCGNASSSGAPPAEPQPTASNAEPVVAKTPSVPWTEPLEPDAVGSLLSVSFLAGDTAPPAFCAARLQRPKPVPEPCNDLETAREILADAFDERAQSVLAEETERHTCDPAALAKPAVARTLPKPGVLDAKLASLESCTGFQPGFVRALRSEITLDCSDVLAVDALKRAAAGKLTLSARYAHILYGSALAAKLQRLTNQAPAFRDKTLEPKQVDSYIERMLGPWAVARAERLRDLTRKVEFIPAQSQGGALARLALIRAWQAFLSGTRGASIPDEWKRDYEHRTHFYSKLDAFQKPFVDEAAKLSASTRFAFDVLGQVRAQEGLTRRFLASESSRVARWSDVLLPQPDFSPPSSTAERLAASIPAPLLMDVISGPELSRLGVLRAALFQGFSVPARVLLASQSLDAPAAELAALGHLTVALSGRSPSRARHARDLAAAIKGGTDAALIGAIADSVASFPENPDAWGSNAFTIDLGPLAKFSGSKTAEGIASLDARILQSIATMQPASTPSPGWEELFARGEAFGQDPKYRACFLQSEGAEPLFLGKRSCACPYTFTR